MERFNYLIGYAFPMAKIKYNLQFSTSVYSALEINNKLYVGGGDWNRRTTLYTRQITKKAKGVLHILKKTKTGFKKENRIIFPSMIYSIIKLSDKNIFAGCKSGKGTFNIIDRDGNIIKQKDDKIGKGVYNSVFNPKKKEIILTTRTGKLEIIDSKLKLKKRIQLSSPKTRLWSLKFDGKLIYAGDYDGFVYVVDKKVKKLDLKTFYPGDKRLTKGFGPSVWGLEVINNKIVLGTRWGDIIILDKDLGLVEKININEDITCIEKLSQKIVLIGTRYGTVFSFNLKNYKISKIMEIKPVLQKENAIWGMSSVKNGVLICFADGNVCKILKH